MKNLTWQNPEQLFVAQELINKVKSKCCGIKDYLEVSQQKHRNHISAPVFIGDGVWICANVIVTPGVKIAPNCIIAAGSVVSKSLTKPLSLYGGVPAVFIKDLS